MRCFGGLDANSMLIRIWLKRCFKFNWPEMFWTNMSRFVPVSNHLLMVGGGSVDVKKPKRSHDILEIGKLT